MSILRCYFKLINMDLRSFSLYGCRLEIPSSFFGVSICIMVSEVSRAHLSPVTPMSSGRRLAKPDHWGHKETFEQCPEHGARVDGKWHRV